MRDLIISGAGGLGREVAWLVERINRREPTWNLLGFTECDESWRGRVINGYPVLGGDDVIASYPDAFVVCAFGSAALRKRVVQKIAGIMNKPRFATLIDPTVDMSELVSVGEGSILCAHTLITVNVQIGAHVIVNPCCNIGHDAVLHDFVTLYPSVSLSGGVRVGECCELGVGARVIQCKTIGAHAIVGAGAIVVGDIPARCTAVGCPARPIKFHDDTQACQ